MTNPSPTLNAIQAKATLQFLARTQLQGAEMPAYVEIFNVLSAVAQSEADTADQQVTPPSADGTDI